MADCIKICDYSKGSNSSQNLACRIFMTVVKYASERTQPFSWMSGLQTPPGILVRYNKWNPMMPWRTAAWNWSQARTDAGGQWKVFSIICNHGTTSLVEGKPTQLVNEVHSLGGLLDSLMTLSSHIAASTSNIFHYFHLTRRLCPILVNSDPRPQLFIPLSPLSWARAMQYAWAQNLQHLRNSDE